MVKLLAKFSHSPKYLPTYCRHPTLLPKLVGIPLTLLHAVKSTHLALCQPSHTARNRCSLASVTYHRTVTATHNTATCTKMLNWSIMQKCLIFFLMFSRVGFIDPAEFMELITDAFLLFFTNLPSEQHSFQTRTGR